MTLQGYWIFRGASETINKLRDCIELREENDIQLHVVEVKKRGKHIRIGDNE